MVLLVILGLGGLCTSILLQVSTQRVIGRAELRYLNERIGAENRLRSEADDAEAAGGLRRVDVPLVGGFSLAIVTPGGGTRSYLGASWELDPDTIIAHLPGATAVRGSAAEGGVRARTGCVSAETRPLVVSAPAPTSGEDEQQPWPRVGLLGVPQLSELSVLEWSDPEALPGFEPPTIRTAPSDTEIRGGDAAGVLIGAGNLTLEGTARFVGLILTAGDLTLRGSSRVEGVALVGGSLRVSEEALLLGCPESTRVGLALPDLDRMHPLPGGWFLGRY